MERETRGRRQKEKGRILSVAPALGCHRWIKNERQRHREKLPRQKCNKQTNKQTEGAVGFQRWDETVHCDTRN